MYSNDRYRVPETSPGRRYSDQRMSSSSASRLLPPDPRDTVRPQPRRSQETDRRGFEMERREPRERIEPFGRRSQEFDYNHGHKPERRDFDRNRIEDEGKRKMAEELKIREQQLAITSNLLQKQSEMLKNMEANIMTRNQLGPSPMMGRNMGPPGPNMGPMDMRPNPRSRSPRRKFEFNNDMDKGRYDGPAPKRFKEMEQDERSNWKKSRGSMTRVGGGHIKGGPGDKCIICKSSNHVARFCPKATKGLEVKGPSIDNACNHCKSPNHFARDCPKNVRKENGKLCNICSSPHHFMRNCPQNSSKDQFAGPKRDDKRPFAGVNKPYGTTSRFASTRGGRWQQFKNDRFKRKFATNSLSKSCKTCSMPGVRDFEAHIKTPEHAKMFELCKAGCKLCSKKRYNSKPQYEKHQISTLHKALVSKKKLVVESKLKPYSSSNTSGIEYVVPVSGFFCKLCKKFYNKESYAKVDHCKTKPHYDKVASMIGSKFETAIGARFQGIKDKLSVEVTDPIQLERKLVEAVRKADFVTDLKPIPEAKKTVAPKAPAASSTQTATEGGKPAETKDKPAETTDKPTETPAKVTIKTEKEEKAEETSADTKETEEESEEKPAEDDGDHEHPDDLEMEVLDDAGGDDVAAAD